MGKISAADKMTMQTLRDRLTACVAAIVITLSICRNCVLHLHFSTKNRLFSDVLFQSHLHTTVENKNQNAENYNFFPKVVWQLYVSEVCKSIGDDGLMICVTYLTFVLHIFLIYSVPNIVEIGQHNIYTAVKWTVDCFFLTHSVIRGVQFATLNGDSSVPVLVDDTAGRWLQLMRTTDSDQHANVVVTLQGARFSLCRRLYFCPGLFVGWLVCQYSVTQNVFGWFFWQIFLKV